MGSLAIRKTAKRQKKANKQRLAYKQQRTKVRFTKRKLRPLSRALKRAQRRVVHMLQLFALKRKARLGQAVVVKHVAKAASAKHVSVVHKHVVPSKGGHKKPPSK